MRGVQILQFSLSFEAEPRTVKKILLESLQAAPEAEKKCEEYARSHGYRNIDHLLESLVESSFSALVIIDELLENLESVLELRRFRNQAGEFGYHFEPFLADLAGEEHDVVASPVADVVVPSGTTDVDRVVFQHVKTDSRRVSWREPMVRIPAPQLDASATQICSRLSGSSCIGNYPYCSREVD